MEYNFRLAAKIEHATCWLPCARSRKFPCKLVLLGGRVGERLARGYDLGRSNIFLINKINKCFKNAAK